MGTVVAGELTGDPVTVREGLHRSLTRTPAVVGVILLVVFLVMTIPFFVSLPLFVLVGAIPANQVEMIGFPAAAAVGGVVFVVSFLLPLFKFWFAPEACVIGQYGPIESLRVSWRITMNYRRKVLRIVLIVLGSTPSFYLPPYLPEMETNLASLTPVLHVISSSAGE